MLTTIRRILDRLYALFEDPFFFTDWQSVPGIGTGAAYAANDAFGLHGRFKCPKKWRIDQVTFQDISDQGIAKYIALFSGVPVAQTDNAALDVVDLDGLQCIGFIPISTADFLDMGSSRIAQVTNLGILVDCPLGYIWYQFRTESTDTITAGQMPRFQLVGVRG